MEVPGATPGGLCAALWSLDLSGSEGSKDSKHAMESGLGVEGADKQEPCSDVGAHVMEPRA